MTTKVCGMIKKSKYEIGDKVAICKWSFKLKKIVLDEVATVRSIEYDQEMGFMYTFEDYGNSIDNTFYGRFTENNIVCLAKDYQEQPAKKFNDGWLDTSNEEEW